MLKNILLTLAIMVMSVPALADHNAKHQCMAIVDFEKEFKEKNPNLVYEVKRYNKIEAINFITFSLIELNIPPPNEDPSLITGLYFLKVESNGKAFLAVLNGEKICSNTLIDKTAFELIMKSFSSQPI